MTQPNDGPLPAEVTKALGVSRHTGGGTVTYTFQKLTAEGGGGVETLHLVVIEHGNVTLAIPFNGEALRDFGEACITNATGLHIAKPGRINPNGQQ